MMTVNKTLRDMMEGARTGETLVIESFLDKLMMAKDSSKEDRVGMHGSGIIASDKDFCLRQQVLSFFFKGKEPNYPVGLLRIFANGWSVHEKWQTLFKKAGVAVGIEQRGESNDWRLLFTPDAIIMIGTKKYVVEIKSVNTYQFKTMKSHPSGEKQLQLYMHMSAIPNGFVLCEDKNTQEIKVFAYEYDPEKARPFVARMTEVKERLVRFSETGKLPPRICDGSGCKRASQCAYREACFGISKIPLNEKEYERMQLSWKVKK